MSNLEAHSLYVCVLSVYGMCVWCRVVYGVCVLRVCGVW